MRPEILVPKYFGAKQILGPKQFWVKRNFGSKKIWVQKICGKKMTARRYKAVHYSRDVITIPLVEVNQAKKAWSFRQSLLEKSIIEAGCAMTKKFGDQ